ncbi:ribonuclease H1 protein [Rutstroemia sp. NJR-2017a BBW]|nr:ribonuclease H1 protein [Rutstroemia sp. NJR-2017a BBW]
MSRDTTSARRRRKLSRRLQGAPQRPPVLTKSPTQKYQRLFSPELYGLKAINDPISGLRRLLTDPNSIVVAVKGTCRHNGHENAIASYGVYFAEDAYHLNENGIVPFPSPQTSQYAGLFAMIKALDRVHQLIIGGENLGQVVVKTDSQYLARGMKEWILKWSRNGYRNFRGKPVVNGRAFKYLHEKMMLLEQEYGILVGFCEVQKKDNERAGRLAREAFY